jgi:uncharacterized protein (DUF1684 family)
MEMTTHEHHEHELQAFRAAKDAYFGENPHSPLGHHERHTFAGLSYYPFNQALRLELPLDRAVPSEVVTVETSTGESQEYQRAGIIHFTVEGQAATLTVYQGAEGELFLPVRDATSGEETYGAGRYLEPQLLDDDRVLVDFNYLYNPYCAYNEAWSCPLPPRENWLTVPLRAGERTFHAHDE